MEQSPVKPNKDLLKVKAESLGFDLFGVTDCAKPEHHQAYSMWLAAGYHGEMHYLETHLPLKADPTTLLLEAKSILVVALNYYAPELNREFKIARYARGDDYHGFMKSMLEKLAEEIQVDFPELVWRSFVDSGPLMERDLAQRAGLGWIGKNTCLIHPQKGSFFLLGCLLTNLDIEQDRPFERFQCGTCTRCIDACPTQAILEPHVLDARQCISYWTIEQRESIPETLRPQLGNWAFGCDICQEVCPWNQRFASLTNTTEFYPREWLQNMPLEQLLLLTPKEFELKIAPKSPVKRPKYRGFIRNLAVVAGNSGNQRLLPALNQALLVHHCDSMLKEHLNWAIQKINRFDKLD